MKKLLLLSFALCTLASCVVEHDRNHYRDNNSWGNERWYNDRDNDRWNDRDHDHDHDDDRDHNEHWHR
jgi:hypothetical protein